eukprot:5477454-Amphidinium_carterae.1
MAIQTCLLVARQISDRPEGSENGLSKAAPKVVSTTTSPVWGVYPLEGSSQAEIQVRSQLG